MDVKEVKVQLNPVDQKALMAPAKTRRRRRVAGGADSEPAPLDTTPLPPAPVVTKEVPVATPEPVVQPPVAAMPTTGGALTPAPLPVAAPAPVPAAPTPPPVITFQAKKSGGGGGSGGSAGAVKPPAGGAHRTAHPTPTARMLPTKRRMGGAPAATIKKPRLHVPTPNVTSVPAEPGSHSGGAAQTRKRKFKERRISISMKPMAATRKARKLLKDRVDTLPIASVRKFLLRKGVLKPKSSPPEAMMRSMLKDYLLLHTAD